jgi:CheY-like chemotaxis protein
LKILYVEDSEDCQFLMSKLLRKHQVRMVETGEEGVVEALDWKPDLVLVDLNLPGIDGYETTGMIRAALDVPVIVVTANVVAGVKERAASAGCDDFLTKPIDRKALLAAIGRWEDSADSTR